MLKKKILVILSSLTLFVCLTTTSVLANPMVPSNSNVSNEILQQNVNSRLAGAQSFDILVSSATGRPSDNVCAVSDIKCEYQNLGAVLTLRSIYDGASNSTNLMSNESITIEIKNSYTNAPIYSKTLSNITINNTVNFGEVKVRKGLPLDVFVYINSTRLLYSEARLGLYSY